MSEQPRRSRALPLTRLVLGILFFYHLGIGVVSLVSVSWTTQFAHWFYGTHIDVDAQFAYTLKALGIYALFTAAVIGVALRDPARQIGLLYSVAGLLAMRAITRLIWFDLLHDGLGVSALHNLTNVALLTLQVAVIVGAARRLGSSRA